MNIFIYLLRFVAVLIFAAWVSALTVAYVWAMVYMNAHFEHGASSGFAVGGFFIWLIAVAAVFMAGIILFDHIPETGKK